MGDRVHAYRSREGRTMLRHGRANVRIAGWGTRGHPGGKGQRRDLSIGTEWRLFTRSGFGWGWKFKWGTNASETTPDLSIHLSWLGDLWIHFGGVIPYRWLERHQPDGRVDYDSRAFGVTFDSRGFRWECWAREGSWSKGQPWWYGKSCEWRILFFGARDYTSETVEDGTTVVPMPEANYPATYEINVATWRHRRPLGRVRDRILGPLTRYGVTITPGKPIPVPGKGENAWDCGDDALHGMSCGGRSVEDAVGKLVASALSTRKRHGGQHMNVPA